jgi:outer membrane protein assembly factor BamD
VCVLLLLAGCGAKKDVIPANVPNPDRFLFERGEAALKEKKWLNAREYFRQVVDNYPQSPLRPEAKLGTGDAYLGEKSAESLVLAETEFREFLTFYPTHPRADYAQYKLAMSFFEQMRSPDRDQTPTREALEEFQVFFDRFPNSPLTPDVRQKWREARDRLSAHNFNVAVLYYRLRVYQGALSRLQEILKEDPEFSGRDGVYYYLAELYLKADTKGAQSKPYYARIVKEFTSSEYLDKAQARLKELEAQ